MSSRIQYEVKLKNIYEKVFRLGVSAKNALEKAVIAFIEWNVDLARKVKLEDAAIDRQQASVDNEIITLIATEAPVAHDLREIFSSVRIAVELERFADHAAHVAKAVLKMKKRPHDIYVKAIQEMSDLCIEMLDAALTAFIEQNAEKAKEAASRDDELDVIHKEYLKKLLDKVEVTDIEDIAQLLFLGKYLERMGDHVTNMCEWIVYSELAQQVELNK